MTADWKKPPGVMVSEPFRIAHVLVHYDGPKAAILTADSEHYIGLASDESAPGRVRWLAAPVSALEIESVIRGRVDLRSVMQKPTLYIIDAASNFTELEVWAAPYSAVPEQSLPAIAARLPDIDDQAAAAILGESHAHHLQSEAHMVVFDGASVLDGTMHFRALGPLLTSLQRVWDAFAQSLESRPTSRGLIPQSLLKRSLLYFNASVAASFGVEVSTRDSELFDKIVENYSGMLGGFHSEAALAERLRELSDNSRLFSALRALFKSVSSSETDVLVGHRSLSVFLSHRRASVLHDWSEASTFEEAPKRLTGFLASLHSTKGMFTFHSTGENAEIISGRVGNVLQSNLKNGIVDYPVGLIRRYIATIHASRRVDGAPSTALLLHLDPVDAGPSSIPS